MISHHVHQRRSFSTYRAHALSQTAKLLLVIAATFVVCHSVFAENVCRVRLYGAVGDGVALDSPAINQAIADCASRGGGTVVVDRGTYRSGTIRFLDNITLQLNQGAVILGSANLADYTPMSQSSEWRNLPLLVAEGVHNIAIKGKGIIDGNGRAFIEPHAAVWRPAFDVNLPRQGAAWTQRMAQLNEGPLTMLPRPGVLFVALHVDGLALHDFHVVDSPNWGIKVGCSQHIDVRGLDVRNDLRIPNNDGLEISGSQNASVSDSYSQAGDDALVIGGPCTDGWCQAHNKHIRVKNVTLISRSAALRIGPSAKGFSDGTFSHITILNSNRGVLIVARYNELLENLSFDHVHIKTRLIDGPWWGAGEPLSISVAHSDYVSWKPTTRQGLIRNLRFADIDAESESPVLIYSFEPGHIHGIDFRNCRFILANGPLTLALGGNLDLQPTSPIDFGVRKQDLPAILLHNAQQISFENLEVSWRGGLPNFYTNAIGADNVDGLTLNGFTGSSAAGQLPAIQADGCTGVKVTNASTTSGPLLSCKDKPGASATSTPNQ